MVTKKTTQAKKTTRKTAVNAISKSKVAKDDIIEIKFKPLASLEFDKDGSPKHIPLIQDYGIEKLALSRHIKFFVTGGKCDVISVSKDKRRVKIRVEPKNNSNGAVDTGWVSGEVIKSITIVDKIRRIKPKSMTYEIVFGADSMDVECQKVSRADVEKVFKVMGEWLGYEVS